MKMTPEQDSGQMGGRPVRFTPEWPPQKSNRPLPNVFTKCSDKFKKVTWPPQEEVEEVKATPIGTIQLNDELPVTEEACYFQKHDTYKAAPSIYAEQPAQLNEDVWPPPENFDTSERVIHDASRPKRVIRDYTVFFNKNKVEGEKSYKVPPGTLHVVSQRGVLSYDNVDIGAARMAEPDQAAN